VLTNETIPEPSIPHPAERLVARGIPVARLDLDDVRPEIPELLGAVGAGEKPGQVHDAEAVEGPHAYRPWNLGGRFSKNARTPSR